MEELKQNEQIQTPKTKKTDEFHLKQITIIALAIFITFCCCILFFFVIYRYNGFTDFWKKLTYILQPVIIGLVVAYLLNPLMKLIDGKLFSLFKGKMKSEKKAKKYQEGWQSQVHCCFGRHYCPADRCDRSIHHPEHTGHHIHTPC